MTQTDLSPSMPETPYPGAAPARTRATGKLYADTPRARNSDPESSHAAAQEVKDTGRLALQQAMVLAAVRAYPGRTARELASYANLDRYMVSRRLPELEPQIRKGGIRTCGIGGRPSVEWWPA